MGKIEEIIQGYTNLISGNGDHEVAQKRLAVCADCSIRMGPICGECYCLIAAAVYATDKKCPLDKW